MNNEFLKNHTYVQQIENLNLEFVDRKVFHEKAGSILQAMGSDDEFLKLVVKRNFEDPGYLSQKWSLYNIPFFYIYESPDYYLKIHFFTSLESHQLGQGASCIHHHNNYILTTAAILGSGYETMLFDKEVDMDEKTLKTKMRITKHFSQAEFPVHTIDAYEPHLVFNPESFSATLQLWTPDRKRSTDALRTNPILKAIKNPLRKIIYACGLERAFGIADAKTYQWYPGIDGIYGIEENEYFEPTRKATGPDVDRFSIQTVCKFLQLKGLVDAHYLNGLLAQNKLPAYYTEWIQKLVQGEVIPETYAKRELNIPVRNFTREQVLEFAK